MREVRRFFGFGIIIFSNFLSHLAHVLIHAGAWLLDEEEVMKGCEMCLDNEGDPW